MYSCVDEITGIMDSQNLWSTNQQVVHETFTNYFSSLFSSKGSLVPEPSHGPQGRVTDSMNADLYKPFTAAELKTSLFQMHPTKAQGYDGFPGLFFQKYWPIFGDTITRVCLQILNEDADFGELNHTLIALIPKVSEPSCVTDFRPISLCSVLYKMISKTIVNRLKLILPRLILEEKSAFVPGRQITDNVLIAFEFMHHIGKTRSGSHGLMALKLDMSKAYDRVEWDFLRWILKEMGFATLVRFNYVMCRKRFLLTFNKWWSTGFHQAYLWFTSR